MVVHQEGRVVEQRSCPEEVEEADCQEGHRQAGHCGQCQEEAGDATG